MDNSDTLLLTMRRGLVKNSLKDMMTDMTSAPVVQLIMCYQYECDKTSIEMVAAMIWHQDYHIMVGNNTVK